MIGIKRFFWPILAYTCVIAIVFGRALLPGATEMIWGDDIHRQYYFYRQFFNNFLSQGIWPWWNPYNFSGAPFMANPIVNIWYPPTWLFIALPLNLAYSWHIAIHIFWAMMGMYVLLNSKLKTQNSKLGAWVGGLVFGLSGFFTARIWAGHVDVIAAASWMPWVVWAFIPIVRAEVVVPSFSHHQCPHLPSFHQRFFAKAVMMLETSRLPARASLVASVILALQLFAGYQTMAMLTLEAVGIMTAISLIAQRVTMKTMITVSAQIGLSVLLAVGLFAVVLLPQQEFFRQTIRTYSLPYFWNAYGSLTWKSLGHFFDPFLFGDQLTYSGPPPNYAEHAFFVGRVGFMLIATVIVVWIIQHIRALSSRRTLASRSLRRSGPGSSEKQMLDSGSPAFAGAGLAGMTSAAVWFISFFCIALFGIWVSLGPNAPIDLQYILWKLVPMYHYLRIPPRHLILVAFGLSGLVGIAMNAINSKSEYRNPKQHQNSNVQNSKQKHILFRIWNFFRFEFVSNFVLRASNFLQLFVAVFIVAEMILFARHFIALKPIPEARHDAELIRILKQDTGPYRVLTNFGAWAPPRDSFDFDAGMNYGVYNATGYDTMILRPYYEFIDAANGATKPSILEHDVQIPYLNVFAKAADMLNIKYILHPRGYDPLYRTKDPRFRLLREDVARDYRLYENTTVLPRFYFSGQNEGKVEIKKYFPNEIILSTLSTTGSILMSSEIYYPGWEGYVDGQKVEVIKANNAFRALFVPAGSHTIMYRYNPRIFFIGGIISFITMCIMAFLWNKSYDVRNSV
ncbi:YfhO family protein [Candidatus Gottesmanbacteria bacterium]|nr:YfhO family protein [Candidatus Gottesmanbacteria bacterium]